MIEFYGNRIPNTASVRDKDTRGFSHRHSIFTEKKFS